MQNELIQSDPGIMMGKPVIVGTRITVALVKSDNNACSNAHSAAP